ncbi:organic cation transporter protein-like isoform X1 [Macrobrachium rosenbergii]|uniref:organic cation transporter protein-like isoform X1 n=2 Tax=Macrobrachium rosenbergii TaxID=79674 RepID=UPI0034D590AC
MSFAYLASSEWEASTMAAADSVEGILTEIGFGRWQGLVLVASLLLHATGPAQQVGSTLFSAPVPFRCSHLNSSTHSPSVADDTDNKRTTTDEDLLYDFPSQCLQEIYTPVSDAGPYINRALPDGVSKISLSQKATGLPSCPLIEYDFSTFDSTVISEWNLVCEDSSFRPLFQMTYSIGAILGCLFCGQMSDWLGRKRTLQIGGLLTLVTVIITSISPWYWGVIFVRILSGTGTILMLFPMYTLISEISPPSQRTITAMLPGLIYFLFMAVLAGVSYILPHWRKLIIACNTPLLLFVPITFLIDESPRWLLQKGRSTEAVDILKKAASQNKVILSSASSVTLDKLSQMSKDIVTEKFQGNGNSTDDISTCQMLTACVKSRGMRTILFVTPFMWLLKRSLYIGIILNANNFTSSNPFEYVALSGTMGVVAILISIPLTLKLPRRTLLAGTLAFGGILLFLELPVPAEYWWAKWIMVMASFCLVCGAFQVNYLFLTELFPTVIRTRGFTFTNLVGSLGEMSTPVVTDIAVQYQWWAPSFTFGLAGIMGGALVLLLPETKDKPLPETLQDAEDRYWLSHKGIEEEVTTISKDTAKRKEAFQV